MTKSIIQISDCHIGKLKNNNNLKRIVADINTQKYDAIVVSGDITCEGLLSEYLEFLHITRSLHNISVLAGNHDAIANMRKVFSAQQMSDFTLGEYRIQLISSKVEGKVSGYIDINTIDTSQQSAIFTHHPIVPMQSNWNDSVSTTNMDEVQQVLNHNIKLVAFGHAHEAKHWKNDDRLICSCPSTAIGFDKAERIGYNIYQIGANGIEVQTVIVN